MNEALIFSGCLENLPQLGSKIVRIFTSSTFTDTTVERNYLMANCYPKLKEYCREKHGLEFQVVDMRWGVRDEATDDHMTTDLCLNEIKSCQKLSTGPNFVVFLGQKYGYRPIPTFIDSSVLEKIETQLLELNENDGVKLIEQWYKQDLNSVPPVAILQPISSILINFNNKRVPQLQAEDQTKWWRILSQLQTLFHRATNELFKNKLIDHDTRHDFFMSVTEREVINGILKVDKPESQCMAYVRIIENINLNNRRKAANYIDMVETGTVDYEAKELLADLRDKRLQEKLAETDNKKRFQVFWIEPDGIHKNTHSDYLKEFNDHFYKQICKMVDKAMEEQDKSEEGEMVAEILQHLHTAKEAVDVFYGRDSEIRQVHDYFMNESNQVFILYGFRGCGKTTFLAKCANMKNNLPNATFVTRFLGTTPDSSTLLPLLYSLSYQIAYSYNMDTKLVPRDQLSLIAFFKTVLTKATVDQPLVILLDSMEQLNCGQEPNRIFWLPIYLPKFCKIVISMPADCTELGLIEKISESKNNFVEIKSFGENGAKKVIELWLAKSSRELTKAQWRLVIAAISYCNAAIFIKLTVAEVLRWRSYSKSHEMKLAKTVGDSINKLFERLEKQHGGILVFHSLAYITAAKNGVSEAELEDLLSLDDKVLDDVYQYHLPPIRRIPPLLWTRIRNDLPKYLTERQADNVIVLNWYHRQFKDTSQERYFKNMNVAQFFHSSLADYFLGIWGGGKLKPFRFTEVQRFRFNLTEKEGNADRMVPQQPNFFEGQKPNFRKLSELPYHLVRAKRYSDLCTHTLFSYQWLLDKLSSCCLQAVIDDFEDAIDVIEDNSLNRELQLLADALRLSGSILAVQPKLFASQMIGRLLPEKQNYRHIRDLLEQCYHHGPTDCGLIPTSHCLHTPGGPLKYCLDGHPFAIFDMKLTNDRRYVVSVSTIFLIWDLSTSNLIRKIHPNIRGIMQKLQLSSSDKWALALTNNSEILLLNLLTYDLRKFQPEIASGINLTDNFYETYNANCIVRYDFQGKELDTVTLTENCNLIQINNNVQIFNLEKNWYKIKYGEKEITFYEVFTVSQSWKTIFYGNGDGRVNKKDWEKDNNNIITSYEIETEKLGNIQQIELDDTEDLLFCKVLKMTKTIKTFLVSYIKGFTIITLNNSNEKHNFLLPKNIKNVIDNDFFTHCPFNVNSDRTLVIAGVRNQIFIWNFNDETLIKVIVAHSERILCFTGLKLNDWDYVLTSSLDKSIKVWNLKNIFGKMYLIDKHDRKIDYLKIIHGYILTVTRNCIGIWTLADNRLKQTLVDDHFGTIITNATITHDATYVLVSETGKFLIWNRVQELVKYRDQITNIRHFELWKNDKKVLILTKPLEQWMVEAEVIVKAIPTGQTLYQIKFWTKFQFDEVLISADQQHVLILTNMGTKTFLKIATDGNVKKDIVIKKAVIRDIRGIKNMNRSKHIVIVGVQKTAIFNIRKRKVVRYVKRWNGYATSDAKYGLFANNKGVLNLIDLKRGVTVRKFCTNSGTGVFSVMAKFDQTDQHILYYHNGTRELKVFRIEDGKVIGFYKFAHELSAMQTTSDGRLIAAGLADGSLILLEIKTTN